MKSIWSALKPTLLGLLGSKKGVAGLSGAVVLLGSSVLSLLHIGGLEPDPAAVDRYVAIVVAYILGQSLVDHNSTAAKIRAQVPTAPTNVVVGELVTK